MSERGSAPAGSRRGVGEVGVELLVEAGAVLASSLELPVTMGQIARLTVPRLADLCVIDLCSEGGSIEKVAVASTEPALARELEQLRIRLPLDTAGPHPVAQVIRSGEPQLLAEMSPGQLESYAEASEHARFMIEHAYRSAIVAPLAARGRTLGALSLLRLGDGAPYAAEELELAIELARRAALALDNAHLFSDLRAVERRLEAILAGLAEAITVEDHAGRTIFANQAAVDLLGAASPEELMAAEPGTVGARFLILDEDGNELGLEQMPGRKLLRGEDHPPLLVRNIVRATGEERWLMVRSSPIVDPDTGRVAFAANVFENITGLKRAQLAESFMAEASRALASSLDYGETLQRIAQLAVPHLADGCVVDIVNDRGELERVAVHHRDPHKLALAERLHERYSPSLDDESGVPEVIRSGEARLFTEITPELITEYARDNEHLRLLAAVEARSVIIAPLAAPARTLGALTFVTSESGRRFTEDDVGVAVRMGRRAGTAVERARLFTERTRIAKVLESALLPESLPAIGGAELRGLYHAAGELNDVGGDFYDVFSYGDDAWMLVIGDVCGKGPRAAGVTALARHTLRAAALLGESPEGMLRTLHEALRRQPSGADLCTVCLATLDLSHSRARVALVLAGHPPPVLVSANGEPALVGSPGTLLGVIDPIEVHQTSIELDPGDTLLLYTDGMTDARLSGPPLGERGLLALCEQAQRRTLAELLDHLAAAARGEAAGRLHDDIALLALRLQGGPADSAAGSGRTAMLTR